jgi:ABC-type lipoprotein export system ATPase subunit
VTPSAPAPPHRGAGYHGQHVDDRFRPPPTRRAARRSGAAPRLVVGACAPAASGEGADVRPFRLPPIDPEQRYVVAVYDIEAEPTRVDVSLLPARERDARLFTDLGSGIGDIVTRELFELGRFQLVERRELTKVLAEQDLGETGRFDASTVPRPRRRPRRRRAHHRDRGAQQVVRRVPRAARHPMSVNKGEVVVVIGPSGSGKSTLIRCINHLEEHQQGRIVVDGIELTDDVRNIDQVRRETGMVFQSFNLFPHLTVLENITLAPIRVRKWKKSQAEERARFFLEKVGIPEQAQKFPGQLSGGQQQRVAIARALTMGPKVMLFDEPTSRSTPR